MNYVGKLFSNFKGFYNEINSATLTGAIDIVVVEQEDGSYECSPFHVRFGKLGVIRSREKIVNIEINGEEVELQMKLGEDGVAYFVQETEEDPEELPTHLATSPLPSGADLMRHGVQKLKEESQKTIENTSNASVVSRDRTISDKSIESVEPRPRNSSELSSKSKVSETSSGSVLSINQGIPALVKKPIDVEKVADSSPDSSKSGELASATVENETTEKNNISRSKRRKRRRNKGKNGKQMSSPQEIKEEEGSIPDFPDQEGIFEMDEERSESKLPTVTTMGRSVSIPRSVSLPQMQTDKMNMTQEWANKQYASYNHPFSDTDITPIVSPVGSRPPTPKSDLDYGMRFEDDDEEDEIKWNWGQLPERVDSFDNDCVPVEGEKTPTNSAKENFSGQDDKANTGLFTFMRQTKKIRHQPEMEGIYLDDLNLEEMDPEVAALYFPKSSGFTSQHQLQPIKDEDNESGRGASLPQSPHSVEGAVGGPSLFYDQDKQHGADHLDVAMSLCGGLKDTGGNIPMERFLQAFLTFDDFCQNPEIISNPDLVVKIADKFYNWQAAAPIVLSLVVYQRPLPSPIVDGLIEKHLPKKEVKKRSGMSSWFSWGRGAPEATPKSQSNKPHLATSPTSSVPSSPPDSPQKSSKEKKLSKSKRRDDGWVTDSSDENQAARASGTKTVPGSYMKTLCLSGDQIKKLHLKDGANEAMFFVTTAYQGTTRAACNIYVWRHDDRIVVSDIDGTITKSDVLGQILPMVGKDWSQCGVAGLYTNIEKNNYRFLYLSARAIGQARGTKDYLRSVKQGALSLPDGPMMLSPSSLINAFHKEVIERKPEEFKISCLRNIKSLFPPQRNPLYAGYGNKINDVWAYRAVGIPISRIFTINPKGEVKSELLQTFTSTYTKLSDFVDHMFPPLQENSLGVMSPSGNFHAADQYSTFTYWRPPLPDIDLELKQVLKS